MRQKRCWRASEPIRLRGWGAVDNPTPEMQEAAVRWLGHQPASTLRSMGQSVVETTGDASYLAALRQVFECHPVYLISGERSHDGWNLPEWALEKSAGFQIGTAP
jgi:lipase